MYVQKAALEVFNPRAMIEDVDDVKSVSELGSLEGKKIGILDNTKSGGNELMPFVQEALESRLSSTEMRIWKVPFALSQETKDPRLKELSDYADGVIALMGD